MLFKWDCWQDIDVAFAFGCYVFVLFVGILLLLFLFWQNVIVSDVVRISLLTKCFARPVKPPIGACLLPEFLAGSPFFKPQFLISHHSIKSAGEKGAPATSRGVLTKLPIELLSLRVKYRKFYQEAEGERTNHCGNISYSSRGSALCEVWGNFSREIQIPFCPTCHLVEQELKIWKVT